MLVARGRPPVLTPDDTLDDEAEDNSLDAGDAVPSELPVLPAEPVWVVEAAVVAAETPGPAVMVTGSGVKSL